MQVSSILSHSKAILQVIQGCGKIPKLLHNVKQGINIVFAVRLHLLSHFATHVLAQDVKESEGNNMGCKQHFLVHPKA